MTSQDSNQNDYLKSLQNRTFALAIISKSHTQLLFWEPMTKPMSLHIGFVMAFVEQIKGLG